MLLSPWRALFASDQSDANGGIVVKSSQHFHASFSKLANKAIYVAAPGAVTVDLKTLPCKKIRRPKWPID